MFKHLEERFPGREKQLEQLSNVTAGVNDSLLLYLQCTHIHLFFYIYSLLVQITLHKVYLYMVLLQLEKQLYYKKHLKTMVDMLIVSNVLHLDYYLNMLSIN